MILYSEIVHPLQNTVITEIGRMNGASALSLFPWRTICL